MRREYLLGMIVVGIDRPVLCQHVGGAGRSSRSHDAVCCLSAHEDDGLPVLAVGADDGKAPVCVQPDVVGAVLHDAQHVVRRQALLLLCVVLRPVATVGSAAERGPGVQAVEYHTLRRQHQFVLLAVDVAPSAIVDEPGASQVVAGILIGCRTHPQQAVCGIMEYAADAGFEPVLLIGRQRWIVEGRVAVVAAQPRVRSHPDVALLVLSQLVDGVARQSVGRRDVSAVDAEVGLGVLTDQ